MDAGGVLLHNQGDVTDYHVKKVDDKLAPFEAERLAPVARGTPPITIASSPAASRSQSRVRAAGLDDPAIAEQIAGANANMQAKEKRKRRKANKKRAEALKTAAKNLALNAAPEQGLHLDTAMFKRKDISIHSSLANSPYLNPISRPDSAMGGISTLRKQLDNFSLASEDAARSEIASANGSGTEGSQPESFDILGSSPSKSTDTVSYEVALDEDFVSHETQEQKDDPLSPCFDDLHRKMTAKDFLPLLCLGKGTFGTVLLVRQISSGRLYAQKTFRKASLTVHKRLIEQTKSERTILESINSHPFIVNLHYAFQDHAKLYLILQYAEGGELFTHLADARLFPEPTAAFYLAELVLALDHLHRTVGVVYRDLKPENCLLDAHGHLLLTDFGLSKVAATEADGSTGRCNSILGTVEYMAPEVVRGAEYGSAVDWWSLGALGYDLLTGDPPFRGANHAAIQAKILKNKPALPPFLTPDAKDLLTRLLRKDPGRRLGAHMPKDLALIRGHRFFRKIDWSRLERRELEPPIRPRVTDPASGENFAAEFTGLPLSPVVGGFDGTMGDIDDVDPFGGFSYVASRSVLEERM